MIFWGHKTNENHYICTTAVAMATKLGTTVTYLEELLIIKSYNGLIAWYCEVTWQTKIILYALTECLWPPIRQDDNLSWLAPTHRVPWLFDYVFFSDHVTNQNYCISTVTVLMATKHGRMMTYFEGFLTIKSHKTLTTWSSKVNWQTETIISPLPKCLWSPNLSGW